MPPDCLPLKLRPVRRAHNLTVVLLPAFIVKKRIERMDPKLAKLILVIWSWRLAIEVLETTDYETRRTHSDKG